MRGGNGLIDLTTAAAWTGRTRKSLQRRYEKGDLKAASEIGPQGQRLFLFLQFEPLRLDRELLAA